MMLTDQPVVLASASAARKAMLERAGVSVHLHEVAFPHPLFDLAEVAAPHHIQLADMVVLSDDPLKVDPMKIADIKVLETIKEGSTVYKYAGQ